MILKGTIVEFDAQNYKATVRIPDLHKTAGVTGYVPDKKLPTALICTLPGISPSFKKGDAVLLCFEQGNYSKPIIISKLFNKKVKSTCSAAEVTDFKATGGFTIELSPKTDKAGAVNVSKTELAALDGIGKFCKKDDKGNVKTLSTVLSELQDSIKSASNASSSTNNYVDKGALKNISKIIVDDSMYGNADDLEKIKSPAEGQLFFLLED